MENIYTHLYTKDKNRKKRGYMANYNLVIDRAKKTYRTFENPYYGYENQDSIEVSKKSDILEYEKYLNNRGFKKENSDF